MSRIWNIRDIYFSCSSYHTFAHSIFTPASTHLKLLFINTTSRSVLTILYHYITLTAFFSYLFVWYFLRSVVLFLKARWGMLQWVQFISSGCPAGDSSRPTASRRCRHPDLPGSSLQSHSPCRDRHRFYLSKIKKKIPHYNFDWLHPAHSLRHTPCL